MRSDLHAPPHGSMADLNRQTGDRSSTIRSGIAPLDAQAGGGIAAGRIHLLTGGVGTGKSLASMQFLGAGLERGERALLLTSARPEDVRGRAAFAGVPIDAALRDGDLVVLRFRPAFATRIAHAASPRAAVEDLARLLGPFSPGRVAVDPVTPYLADGTATGEGLAALAAFLEELRATALLTYPGDVSNGADRRFDSLIDRAASVMHITRASDGVFTLGVLRGQSFGPGGGSLRFSIAPSSGIIAASDNVRPPLQARPAGSPVNRHLTLVHYSTTVAAEILELLQRDYRLSIAPASSTAANGAHPPDSGALLIETHHGALDSTAELVRRSAARRDAVAIIVVVRFNLRSIDRARLLRAGADEVLTTDMSPAELLQRLSAAVSRGHLERPTIQYAERVLTQAQVGGNAARPLDRGEFAAALAAHVAHDHPTQYTVVSMAPGQPVRGTEATGAALAQLADVVMRTARIATGDLVACFDERLAVYLHGARLDDAAPFVERVRGAWPSRERKSIDVDFLSYPSDEPRLRTLMETSRQS